MKLNRTLRDCVYGMAVGDALGVPFEFKPRGSFECVDMVGGGSHNQLAGTWSDDTSMALALCDSYRELGRVDCDDILRRFRAWINDGAYTADGVAFDYGNATRKALALIDGEGRATVCFVPGDHEMNDVKAEHVFGDYHMMTDEELRDAGLVKGFIGPVGLPEGIRVVADASLKSSEWWLVGANLANYHYRHAQMGRDFTIDEWVDVVCAREGDLCPHCGKPMHAARGIEISQVFQLGTKYSESMGATFMDEDGREKPFLMGCYGIGVSRMVSAVVEQHSDERGICWPVCVAPYEVEVVAMSVNDDVVWPVASKVTEELAAADLEVVVDDRKERPGVKFADADLIGIPYQVILGKKGVAAGKAEVKVRETGERFDVPFAELSQWLRDRIVPARA